MKGYLKALKVTNYAWLALIFLILILAAIPAIPGAVQVKLPSEWRTTDVDGRINITGDVMICNGGIFALDDFQFSVMLISDSGSSLATFESEEVDLNPGPWIKFPVSFEVEDASTASSDVRDLFFSRVTFTSMLYFSASYILGFKVETMVIGSASLGPLVRDFEVHTNQTFVHHEDEFYCMEVPYDIDTSLLLYGQNLYVWGLVSNETSTLGVFNSTAALGGFSNGFITIYLTYDEYHHLITSSDTLLMECIMDFGPFSWEQNLTMDWSPPDMEMNDLVPGPGPHGAAATYWED